MILKSQIDISNMDQLLGAQKLVIPKKVKSDSEWTLEALQEHLQWAVDIEFFTIPFYMSAMYSVLDQSAEARRLVRSVVNQEMLHMQSAANLANAYGTDLVILAPSYGGAIPHLDFALDHPNPTDIYTPYSTAIGPMDVERINAMCIVEYPDWCKCSSRAPEDEYGTIGEFYDAVKTGAALLAENIQGNRNQVGHFSSIYPDAPNLTITKSGREALEQVNNLIELIVTQGEGRGEQSSFIPRDYQNRVDDLQPTWDHYGKFTYLREQPLPETYPLNFGNANTQSVQDNLVRSFGEFLVILNKLFRGQDVPDFAPVMFKVGGGIAACWENGTLPVFSKPIPTGGDK